MSQQEPIEPSREAGPFRRTVDRHWRGFLVVWLFASLAAGFVVYLTVWPSYKAINLIRVEPAANDLFGVRTNNESFDQFLQTQIQLITSPNVLTVAATNPKVAFLPRIRNAKDVVQDIRKAIHVNVLPGTYLIEVSMTSTDGSEAAVIVNAVVDAYLDINEEWSDGMTRSQIKNLEAYARDLQGQTDELERQWKVLVVKGDLDRQAEPKPADQVDKRTAITIEQFRRLGDELFGIRLELVQAEAWLDELKAAPKGAAPGVGVGQVEMERQVERRFQLDPEIVESAAKLLLARRKLEEVEKVKPQEDPEVQTARAAMLTLKAEFNQLSEVKSMAFRAVLERTAEVADAEEELREAETRVRSLKVRQEALKRASQEMEVKGFGVSPVDTVTIQLIMDKRATIKAMQETVLRRLEQLRFERKGETRIRLVHPNGAMVPGKPIADHRAVWLGLVPIATFFLSFGLFLGFEVWRGPRALGTRKDAPRAEV